jgi:lipopolysaccharide/colanic/teichoic acid biosynthesis glycosyltransferase
MIKRLFDITISFLLLCIICFVFLIISVIIKITMPGPILFRQSRVGKNGKLFRLNKFRTMKVLRDAEQGSFDAGNKSRITPLGKILRKTKLDELPQLINVLIGEMSIVGPRPEVKQWTEIYSEKWAIVHSVKPGITDNASILFRNEEDLLYISTNPAETYKMDILPKKLDLYIDYVKNQSLMGDLKIILKTIYTVIVK